MVLGSIFFSAQSIRKNPLSLADSLSEYYRHKALVPQMVFKDRPVPQIPVQSPIKGKKGKLTIRWKVSEKPVVPKYHVIYRFESYKPEDFQNGKNIFAIVPYDGNKTQEFVDGSTQIGLTYTYVITAVNHNHQESLLSNQRTIKNLGKKFKRIK